MALVQSPSSPLAREELREKGSKREMKKKKEGEEKRRQADPRGGVSSISGTVHPGSAAAAPSGRVNIRCV